MQRLVCYAQMAIATGRKLCLVPQYASEHYKPEPRRGGVVEDEWQPAPALDYLEYMDVSSFGPRAVNWKDAPAGVKGFRGPAR